MGKITDGSKQITKKFIPGGQFTKKLVKITQGDKTLRLFEQKSFELPAGSWDNRYVSPVDSSNIDIQRWAGGGQDDGMGGPAYNTTGNPSGGQAGVMNQYSLGGKYYKSENRSNLGQGQRWNLNNSLPILQVSNPVLDRGFTLWFYYGNAEVNSDQRHEIQTEVNWILSDDTQGPHIENAAPSQQVFKKIQYAEVRFSDKHTYSVFINNQKIADNNSHVGGDNFKWSDVNTRQCGVDFQIKDMGDWTAINAVPWWNNLSGNDGVCYITFRVGYSFQE